MVPSGRERGRRKTQKAKKSTEGKFKPIAKKPNKPSMKNDADANDGDHGGDALPSGCRTPKDQRLPACMACPPAPKKRRVAAIHCSTQKPPVSFFTPPDLELFFLFAFPDVSV